MPTALIYHNSSTPLHHPKSERILFHHSLVRGGRSIAEQEVGEGPDLGLHRRQHDDGLVVQDEQQHLAVCAHLVRRQDLGEVAELDAGLQNRANARTQTQTRTGALKHHTRAQSNAHARTHATRSLTHSLITRAANTPALLLSKILSVLVAGRVGCRRQTT